MDEQFNIPHDNLTVDLSKDYRLDSKKDVNESIRTIVSTKPNDSTLLSSRKHLNGLTSKNSTERRMDSKTQTTKEVSKECGSDATNQRLQTTSRGNMLDDRALLMSKKIWEFL